MLWIRLLIEAVIVFIAVFVWGEATWQKHVLDMVRASEVADNLNLRETLHEANERIRKLEIRCDNNGDQSATHLQP